MKLLSKMNNREIDALVAENIFEYSGLEFHDEYLMRPTGDILPRHLVGGFRKAEIL